MYIACQYCNSRSSLDSSNCNKCGGPLGTSKILETENPIEFIGMGATISYYDDFANMLRVFVWARGKTVITFQSDLIIIRQKSLELNNWEMAQYMVELLANGFRIPIDEFKRMIETHEISYRGNTHIQ